MIIEPFTCAYMSSCWWNLAISNNFPFSRNAKFDRKSAHTKSIYRIMRKSDMALFFHRFVNHFFFFFYFFSSSPSIRFMHFRGIIFRFAPSPIDKKFNSWNKKKKVKRIKRTTAIQGWEMKNENVILHPKEYQRCAVWECQ